nr:RUN and FYVE domain-containing protein 4 [Cavia porcellus]
MAKDRASLKVTRDLKAAVSAILQGYGDGKGAVTDASAELHRLCGCLELLLQVTAPLPNVLPGLVPRRALPDTREDGCLPWVLCKPSLASDLTPGSCHYSLGKRWGKAGCRGTRLWGYSEKNREDSRSLGSPQSLREPKELQLDQEEKTLRTKRLLENSTGSIQQQKEGAKEAQKEKPKTEAENRGVLPGPKGQGTEGSPGKEAERDHGQAPLASSPREPIEEATSENRQGQEVSTILGESWVLQDLGEKKVFITEQPQEQTEVTGVARKEEQAEVCLQDMVKTLRHGLRKAEEQAQRQEQLLRARDGELQALQKQLHRCEEERAQLQAELRQKQQEADRREAMYEEERGGHRDLIQAMKRRMLELIQEKDRQWQRLQQLSDLVPRCCLGCSKVFGRLSRRYPCRRCGGLVCHSCSADYKKRECCCPYCAQGEAQVT